MVGQEWKYLLKNRILILVLIAVIAIPFIYTGLFLKSMWDPYGSLDRLPVAVVNNDKPVEYEGKKLEIGNDLVEELKKNDSLDFHFTNRKEADEGLRKGTLYMVITVPEDFSADAATLLEEHPEKMELGYRTNPGTNYIASKMSETALTKIRDEVADQVTKTYTRILFDRIGSAGQGMQEAADGSQQISSGIRTAEDGNAVLTDGLKKLSDSTLDFSEGGETLSVGLKQYTEGVEQAADGAAGLNEGIRTLEERLPGMTGGIKELNSGIIRYTDGVDQLNEQSGLLVNGSEGVKAGNSQVQSGLDSLKTGTDLYAGSVNTFGKTVRQYTEAEEQLAVLGQKLEPLENLGTISSELADLNHLFSEGDSSAENKASELEQGLQNLYAQLQKMSDESSSPGQPDSKDGNSGVQERAEDVLSECVEDANSRIDGANSRIGDMDQKLQISIQDLKNVRDQLSGQESGGEDAAASLDEIIRNLEDCASDSDRTDRIEPGVYEERIRQISAESEADGQDDNFRSGSVESAADMAGRLYSSAQDLNEQIQSASGRIGQLQQETDNLPEAAAAVSSLNQGLNRLQDQNGKINAGTESLEKAGNTVTSGISRLSAGNYELMQGITELNQGISDYTAGAAQISQNSSSLREGGERLDEGASVVGRGVSALASGASRLSEGARQLTQSNEELNSGASALSDGANQLKDGALQLYSGSGTLGSGLKRLQEGSDRLTGSLSEGAESAAGIHAGEETVSMFASPVKASESQMTKVENNGHAMAPYMMSVGLWVGCLAFCLVYPLTRYTGKLKSGFAWWAGKASVLYPVALLQGILMVVLLHFVDGFQPEEMLKTLLFSCLTAVAFTSVMYFFNVTLGKVGSFLMLVFMVVQLSGSAGTYPVEISPSFVSEIHAFLPFTYTVDAFRRTICGGESIRTSVAVMAGLAAVFTLLTILRFCHMSSRRKKGKMILLDKLEEKGLA